jgi:hypothetical protein
MLIWVASVSVFLSRRSDAPVSVADRLAVKAT